MKNANALVAYLSGNRRQINWVKYGLLIVLGWVINFAVIIFLLNQVVLLPIALYIFTFPALFMLLLFHIAITGIASILAISEVCSESYQLIYIANVDSMQIFRAFMVMTFHRLRVLWVIVLSLGPLLLFAIALLPFLTHFNADNYDICVRSLIGHQYCLNMLKFDYPKDGPYFLHLSCVILGILLLVVHLFGLTIMSSALGVASGLRFRKMFPALIIDLLFCIPIFALVMLVIAQELLLFLMQPPSGEYAYGLLLFCTIFVIIPYGVTYSISKITKHLARTST